MKTASRGEILRTFATARRDGRTNVSDRRVLAQIQRTGRVGDLKRLALACQISRDRLDVSLDRLSELGYIDERGMRTSGLAAAQDAA